MYEEYSLERLDLVQQGLINTDQYLHNMFNSFLKAIAAKEGKEQLQSWIEEYMAGEA